MNIRLDLLTGTLKSEAARVPVWSSVKGSVILSKAASYLPKRVFKRSVLSLLHFSIATTGSTPGRSFR